jgi:hypothetical protein
MKNISNKRVHETKTNKREREIIKRYYPEKCRNTLQDLTSFLRGHYQISGHNFSRFRTASYQIC